MALRIRRHDQVPSKDGHRWRVELEDDRSVDVELPAEERESLELTDDELHALLPTALDRHAATAEEPDVAWDSPVRLYAQHFGA